MNNTYCAAPSNIVTVPQNYRQNQVAYEPMTCAPAMANTGPCTLWAVMWNLGRNLYTALEFQKAFDWWVRGEHFRRMRRVNFTTILNPLAYAWNVHEEYLAKVPRNVKILFVGINPSAESQSGLPFYEETAMAELFGRALEDGSCKSGQRFWQFMRQKFGSTQEFFRHCFVINYCPLIFMDQVGGYESIDGFNQSDSELLQALMGHCDEALQHIIRILNPGLIVGVGWYAFNRLNGISNRPLLRVRHPSPNADFYFDPMSNRQRKRSDWEVEVEMELKKSSVWAALMREIQIKFSQAMAHARQ